MAVSPWPAATLTSADTRHLPPEVRHLRAPPGTDGGEQCLSMLAMSKLDNTVFGRVPRPAPPRG